MTSQAARGLLRVLCNLRWLEVIGQAVTVYVVTGPMGIALPIASLTAAIAALAIFNLYAAWRIRRPAEPHESEVLVHLLVDIAALTWLIAFSGGIENPFASLFLLPIALSILMLPPRLMSIASAASVGGYLVSTLFGRSLPHSADMMENFGLHKVGMLATFVLSGAVLLVFFTRVAAARRRSEREVAQLREQFTRNEGILALATHAASVAHELNTPLGTLTLMVDELSEAPASDAQREDFATLSKLLEICRDRVRALAEPASAESASPLARHVDLNSVVQNWQLVRPTIELRRSGSIAGYESVDAGVGHLLQALLNNAADAGQDNGIARVDLRLEADAAGVRGEIRDYGKGFADQRVPLPPALFRSGKPDGLGLGLALSHATVERLGGELSLHTDVRQGVRVAFNLPAIIA